MSTSYTYDNFLAGYTESLTKSFPAHPGRVLVNLLGSRRPDLLRKLVRAGFDPQYATEDVGGAAANALRFVREHWDD
jgi:hypothetical protein